MSETAIFWDSRGNATELPPFPDSFQKSAPGDEAFEQYRAILQAVEAALSLTIVGLDVCSQNDNLVLEVEYEDGRRDIVRTPNPAIPDDERDNEGIAAMTRQAELLKWLNANTSLSVPAIRCVVDGCSKHAYPIVVMEKLPGKMVLNCIGRASRSAKASKCERLLHAFAEFQIQLFRLSVPQRIGTACVSEGNLDVVPMLDAPVTGYSSLEDYVLSALQARERRLSECQDADTRARGAQILSRIRKELCAILALLQESFYRRCVLKHDDLAPVNMLMNDVGDLTGIIDWDYQSVLPAVLAVEYPSFIRYDGVLDPAYVLDAGEGMEIWWFVSPDDARSLKALYTEIARAKDAEYHAALDNGELLRHIVDWLGSSHELAVIARWMDTVFPPA
ncbi:hypothetical protein GY45DRAFT_1303754 [Cubamyces sp. BRFM 1775]|nr:hypothetical protein GY45DRAFT_1303754 [Cubamyces sp. BRFM 1775]